MTNGTLQYKIKQGGGIDEVSGDPIPVTESWSDPIDALVTPSNGKLIKYQDGAQVAASYQILIEIQEFQHTSIKITDSRGNDLGEYQVLGPNIQFLDTAQRVKIIV